MKANVIFGLLISSSLKGSTVLLLGLVLVALIPAPSFAQESKFSFDPFGEVHTYQNGTEPNGVVLFISGDKGWDAAADQIAKELANNGALVAGFDIKTYLKNIQKVKHQCGYVAAQLQNLGKYAQKRAGLKSYYPPIVIGYGAGGTLAYIGLAQAPPNSFSGAVSIGFCSKVKMKKAPCANEWLHFDASHENNNQIELSPMQRSENPWVLLSAKNQGACSAEQNRKFAQQATNTKFRSLTNEASLANPAWQKAIIQGYNDITAQSKKLLDTLPAQESQSTDITGLPLVELAQVTAPERDLIAVIISGDGGWADIDKSIAQVFVTKGIRVVGLNSLQYLWSRKDAKTLTDDMTRLLNHYLKAWNKTRAIIVGYSLGADLAPFMAQDLAKELKSKISRVALIGPDETVDFEFHLTDWIGGSSNSKTEQPTLPAVQKLHPIDVQCFEGEQEHGSLCPKIPKGFGQTVLMHGGHHMNGDYEGLANLILGGIK